ncbi:hypothetical protein STAPHY8AQ_20540 [Staphylococcus sp. 8AQ]|nr:hypothetical protein STAPHY8AQ_20540 [Staphylococcus sp. 8AQ]
MITTMLLNKYDMHNYKSFYA